MKPTRLMMAWRHRAETGHRKCPVAGSHSFQIKQGPQPGKEHAMKKQDIRHIYTQKVTELLNQGHTIFPDTMSGSQGEIAHIDLTNGSEIIRVLLTREHRWDRDEDGYTGDTILLTVGRAAPDTRVFDNWDGTVWNSRLEPLFQIEWAWVGSNRRHDWYTDMEEGKRISRLQWERYKAQKTERRETLGDAFKSTALRWLRKQPKMKTCRLEDIEKMERVWNDDGKRSFQITAKGRQYTIR